MINSVSCVNFKGVDPISRPGKYAMPDEVAKPVNTSDKSDKKVSAGIWLLTVTALLLEAVGVALLARKGKFDKMINSENGAVKRAGERLQKAGKWVDDEILLKAEEFNKFALDKMKELKNRK